jgi:hypothetical protein
MGGFCEGWGVWITSAGVGIDFEVRFVGFFGGLFFKVMTFADFARALSTTVGGDKVVGLNQFFRAMLEEMGLSIHPLSVDCLFFISFGVDSSQQILPHVILSDVEAFERWSSNNCELLSKEELLAISSLPALIARGLTLSGVNRLTEQDFAMFSQGKRLAAAFAKLGLDNSGLFFQEISKAHRGGYIEPFLVLESFTDYPWVRPRPEAWDTLLMPEIVHRVRSAANALQAVSLRLGEYPEQSRDTVWKLMARVSNVFETPSVTSRLSTTFDALASNWGLACELADALNFIKSIRTRRDLDRLFGP